MGTEGGGGGGGGGGGSGGLGGVRILWCFGLVKHSSICVQEILGFFCEHLSTSLLVVKKVGKEDCLKERSASNTCRHGGEEKEEMVGKEGRRKRTNQGLFVTCT